MFDPTSTKWAPIHIIASEKTPFSNVPTFDNPHYNSRHCASVAYYKTISRCVDFPPLASRDATSDAPDDDQHLDTNYPFVLFANCIPVRGARRSIICDCQTGRFDFIPNSLHDMLTQFPKQRLDKIRQHFDAHLHMTIDSYYSWLAKRGYGFFTDEPGAFPDLPNEWHTPSIVANAIIDLDSNSRYDVADVMLQLLELRCRTIEVRCFHALAADAIEDLLSRLPLNGFLSVALTLRYSASLTVGRIEEICARDQSIRDVVLHAATRDYRSWLRDRQVRYWETLSELSSSSCGVVHQAYFAVNAQHIFEAQRFNSCLNRKIGIDVNGFIKNCPSMSRSFGSVTIDRIAAMMDRSDFASTGSITKDQISECKDCEFRYICTDCRAFTLDDDPLGKPAKCKYDPYTATWR